MAKNNGKNGNGGGNSKGKTADTARMIQQSKDGLARKNAERKARERSRELAFEQRVAEAGSLSLIIDAIRDRSLIGQVVAVPVKRHVRFPVPKTEQNQVGYNFEEVSGTLLLEIIDDHPDYPAVKVIGSNYKRLKPSGVYLSIGCIEHDRIEGRFSPEVLAHMREMLLVLRPALKPLFEARQKAQRSAQDEDRAWENHRRQTSSRAAQFGSRNRREANPEVMVAA